MEAPPGDTEVPEPVREARARVKEHQRAVGINLAGMMAAILLVVFGANLLPGVGVYVVLVLFFAWLAYFVVAMSRRNQSATRAMRLLQEWDRRQLDEMLGPVAQAAPESEPDDPRWSDANKLLDRVRALAGADPRLAAMADGLTERLRSLLGDLDVLGSAAKTEASLDGDEPGPRLQRLKEATERKEATVTRILETLRDLHVALALRESGDGDAMLRDAEDLVQRLEAEAEVANVGERLPREAPQTEDGTPRPPRGREKA